MTIVVVAMMFVMGATVFMMKEVAFVMKLVVMVAANPIAAINRNRPELADAV